MWPGTWRNPSLPTGCCGWCARCWTRTSGGACAHQSTCVVGPNLLAFGYLVWYYASSAERWPSGRRRSPAKRLQGLYLCRGFESRPLRHGASARRRTEDRDGRGVAPQGAPVAQWIERLPPEQEVGRSNRPGRTKQKLCDRKQKTGQRRPPPGSARPVGEVRARSSGDRALACGARSRPFESARARQYFVVDDPLFAGSPPVAQRKADFLSECRCCAGCGGTKHGTRARDHRAATPKPKLGLRPRSSVG
jgi:hypothetical protein